MEEEAKLRRRNLLTENQNLYPKKSLKNLHLDPGDEVLAVESEVEVISHFICFITFCIHKLELWAALRR